MLDIISEHARVISKLCAPCLHYAISVSVYIIFEVIPPTVDDCLLSALVLSPLCCVFKHKSIIAFLSVVCCEYDP